LIVAIAASLSIEIEIWRGQSTRGLPFCK